MKQSIIVIGFAILLMSWTTNSCKKAEIPIVTTSEISGILTNTAICGGNIINTGSETILACGVCWSSIPDPSIENEKTVDGQTIGSFTSNMTGLIANTIYYVRAYATNSAGTAYGDQMEFKTCTGIVTDVDRNVYYSITIGTQVWMRENLKTTKYNDGTSIPNVTDASTWSALTSGVFCDYNNIPANSEIYGRLYNWYVVDNNPATSILSNGSKNVCPTGWHVPTKTEWITLADKVGGAKVAGDKLKEKGTLHWKKLETEKPNNSTNETGFTALPGGYRGANTIFGSQGYWGIWWSSSGLNGTYSWDRGMTSSSTELYEAGDYKYSGFSVRCIKNE